MSTKVRVYRNVNNGRLSIQDVRSRLILGHCEQISLHEPKFIVSEVGRQRVLARKRKEVHAYVEGMLQSISGFQSFRGRRLEHDGGACTPVSDQGWTRVRYNPYLSGHFLDEQSNPVHSAERIVISSNGQMLIQH